MTYEVQLGRTALSKAGRDSGRRFLITGIVDDKFVFVADGVLRKVAKPKRKKLMHLKLEAYVSMEIAALLQDGKQVQDCELRKFLEGIPAVEKEVSFCQNRM